MRYALVPRLGGGGPTPGPTPPPTFHHRRHVDRFARAVFVLSVTSRQAEKTESMNCRRSSAALSSISVGQHRHHQPAQPHSHRHRVVGCRFGFCPCQPPDPPADKTTQDEEQDVKLKQIKELLYFSDGAGRAGAVGQLGGNRSRATVFSIAENKTNAVNYRQWSVGASLAHAVQPLILQRCMHVPPLLVTPPYSKMKPT